MDGLKRAYTKEERAAFLAIDPYFLRELALVPADARKCTNRIFMEGNGHIRTCNISPVLDTTEGSWKTICADGHILAGITALSLEKIPMFFATTLPYPEAQKQCREIWSLFSGGIFAGGAHLVLKKEDKEKFFYVPKSLFQKLNSLKQKFHFRILTYKNPQGIYKITLCRPARRSWNSKEVLALIKTIPEMCFDTIRYFIEGNCLQIVSFQATKANGVHTLCKWSGVLPGETAAAGDSGEDARMLKLCGMM